MCWQEEIRWCLSPELFLSRFLCAPMADNEVVVQYGTERYCSYQVRLLPIQLLCRCGRLMLGVLCGRVMRALSSLLVTSKTPSIGEQTALPSQQSLRWMLQVVLHVRAAV